MLLMVSRKHERQCEKCGRWFSAWDTGRTLCYLHDKTDTEGKKLERDIEAGREKL